MSAKLLDPNTGQPFALPATCDSLLVGRAHEADLRIAARDVSRRQLLLHPLEGGWTVEPLSANVPTFVGQRQLKGRRTLANGDVLRFGSCQLEYQVEAEAAARDSDLLEAPPVPAVPAKRPSETMERPRLQDDRNGTLMGTAGLSVPVGEPVERLAVAASGVIGRGEEAAHALPHPRVSRRHAELVVEGRRVGIRDLDSANGTFVNGERLTGFRQLTLGDRVDIGPYALTFRGDAFVREDRKGNARLEARGLGREVPDPKTRGMRRIFDGIDLVIEPRQFVAILGPTGSGKSTLLKALSAREPATEGVVHLNGVNLYAAFESLKESIAFVPQREVLHDSLTLDQALGYTASLRLPPDTSREDIAATVRTALEEVELGEHGGTCVGRLSGGQRKRASLANETTGSPDLIFADEVTSGLDEQTDWEIMRLLRRQADEGATVVCVTHTLANVEEFCHKLIVMDVPGVVAFFGTPAEARAFFGVPRLGEIYRKLKDPKENHSAAYRSSEYFQRHVASLRSEGCVDGAELEPPAAIGRPLREHLVEVRRQFRLLIGRLARLMSSDRQALGIALAQALTVGAVLALVFAGLADATGLGRDRLEEALVFLLGASSLWFGCNNASKELVKERDVYRQERDVNLSVPAYLLAKVAGLAVCGCSQVLVLFSVVAALCQIPGPPAWQLVTMLGTVLAATTLGLAISAVARTTDQATTAVPLVLIPQIVMGGLIVRDMPIAAEILARAFVSGRWVYHTMEELLLEGGLGGGAPLGLAVLGLHALGYAIIALVVLIVRDSRGEQRYGEALKAWVANARESLAKRKAETGTDA